MEQKLETIEKILDELKEENENMKKKKNKN